MKTRKQWRTIAMTTAKTLRNKVVDDAKKYIGAKQGSKQHKHIIDVFNTVKPDGGAMTYTAYWCAAFASAIAIEALGKEYAKKYFPLSWSCITIITKAKKLGIWKESDAYKPSPGDWLLYDWEDNGKGDCKGDPNHVGIVEKVSKGSMTIIEGNMRNAAGQSVVGERTVAVNGKYIRGFVVPDYEKIAEVENKRIEKEKQAKAKAHQKAIADTAKKLAYPGRPDEARYPSGHPTKEFKKALNDVYPNRKTWSDAPKKGASCDVFAGTVIRESGVDPKFPRGLTDQIKYLEKSDKFELVTPRPAPSKMRDGDIIVYKKLNGGGHICIHVKGKVKHAQLKKWYGSTTNNLKTMLSMKNKKGKVYKKWIKVYRAK